MTTAILSNLAIALAAIHQRSMEAEARAILAAHLADEPLLFVDQEAAIAAVEAAKQPLSQTCSSVLMPQPCACRSSPVM